jgi:predicted enzyme related to lactoylglutathione lyase
MSKHPVVHIEIPAVDAKTAGKFYSDVFGWNITHDDVLNYTMFEYAERQGGGFSNVSEENPVGKILIYLQTDDIEATLAKIEAHGGKTILPKSEIPNTGWFAFFQDPVGNTLALYKGMNTE